MNASGSAFGSLINHPLALNLVTQAKLSFVTPRLTDQEIIDSMKKGTTWPKCHQKHVDAKSNVSELLGKQAA